MDFVSFACTIEMEFNIGINVKFFLCWAFTGKRRVIEWRSSSSKACVCFAAITCGHPNSQNIKNVSATNQLYMDGESVVITCEDGYDVYYNHTQTFSAICSDDGAWLGLLNCTGKLCLKRNIYSGFQLPSFVYDKHQKALSSWKAERPGSPSQFLGKREVNAKQWFKRTNFLRFWKDGAPHTWLKMTTSLRALQEQST